MRLLSNSIAIQDLGGLPMKLCPNISAASLLLLKRDYGVVIDGKFDGFTNRLLNGFVSELLVPGY